MVSDRLLSDLMAEAAQRAGQLRKMQAGLQELEGRAESEDGLVKVTVDASGELVGLELDPRIHRKPDTETLAKTITETIRQARLDVNKQGEAVAEDIIAGYHDDEDADPLLDPVLREFDRLAQGRSS